MLKSKRLAIAAAVAVACAAVPVFGQSFATRGAGTPGPVDARMSDTPGDRAAAVIRSIERENPEALAVELNVADLATMRGASEAQLRERSAPVVVERLLIDDARRPGDTASTAAFMRNSTSAKRQDKPQVVHIEGQAKDRTKTQAVTRLDDRARYREQARYDADRKRETVSANEQTGTPDAAAPRVNIAQGRAEIRWSEPEEQTR